MIKDFALFILEAIRYDNRADEENMPELVRNQRAEKAAGMEEVIYSSRDMLVMEHRNRRRHGKLADLPVYSIPYAQIKKSPL